MDVLVSGISGYVGSQLVPRLLADGHSVRGMSRRAGIAAPVEVVRADAVSGAGLDRALAGADVAYYLIHSMEPSTDGTFGQRERTAAQNFARAASAAGVQRIIYLGGPRPAADTPSAHLASRLAVEEILLGGDPVLGRLPGVDRDRLAVALVSVPRAPRRAHAAAARAGLAGLTEPVPSTSVT